MDELAQAMKAMPALEGELVRKMMADGRVVEVPAGTELLHEGAYVHELPILLEGLVRVFIGHEDKELLLYFIEPSDSCVMSFAAMTGRTPSRINAVAERPSKLLMVPEVKLRQWMREHPSLSELFFQQYHERYNDMLHTVEQVAFGDLPTRLMDHLKRLKGVTGDELLDVRHARLAQELGSAREVITRTLRKLEDEGRIRQLPGGIRVLG
ncbi:MAG: Crp/Fnr family transcriptional regulator [Flavobacteriales bacterium]|nr:Crp/Fnr family transcriptional regulator [Flavobacteriales bacterium]MBK7941054.1 Crp/Fnr family transcriptional regulator [Flavobacteriales bacterium]MBK9701081.1 Crp/Fnr family transcriptional regulator [Flavobacteriales bacterium]